MPRVCSICIHMDRLAIKTALGSGTLLRTIAARWSVSKTALLRHRDAHMDFTRQIPPATTPTVDRDQWDLDIEMPPRVETTAPLADAGAQALAAYHEALAAYNAIPQRDISRLPGFKAALLEVQGLEVERR